MAQEAIPFDTHRFVQNLVASGFTETQAEALASEQINLLNSNLATKSDIAAVLAEVNSLKSDLEILRISTQSDIEALRLSTKSDIEAFQLTTEAKIVKAKYDIVKWLIGAMVAQSAIIISMSVTLSKLL